MFGPIADPVETALAKALEAATVAGRFDVVAQPARELEARRLAKETNVVTSGAASTPLMRHQSSVRHLDFGFTLSGM